MDDTATTLRTFTPPELANFLAAQAVAAATSFIDKRSDACDLAQAASRVNAQLNEILIDARSREIIDVTRLMVTAMIHTAITSGPRAQRWADVMAAFVPLLRHESTDLAATGAQRQ